MARRPWPGPVLLFGGERPKSSESVWPEAKEERRCVGEDGGEFSDVIADDADDG